jgi:hypothetical protein
VLDAGLARYAWLASATGWAGFKMFEGSGGWVCGHARRPRLSPVNYKLSIPASGACRARAVTAPDRAAATAGDHHP